MPQPNAEQRAAIKVLRRGVKAGALQKGHLLLDLFAAPACGDECACARCQEPHARARSALKLNSNTSERALARELGPLLAQELSAHADIVSASTHTEPEEVTVNEHWVNAYMRQHRDMNPAAVQHVYVRQPNGSYNVEVVPHGNARGSREDARQMVADLISDDAAPFTPDDAQSLRSMSIDTLRVLRDRYLPDDDPAIAAMSAHGNVRQELDNHRRQQRGQRVNALLRQHAVETAADDPAVLAMTAHENLRTPVKKAGKRAA